MGHWNRKMRDILVRTQVRDVNSCANGSWDPAKDAVGQTRRPRDEDQPLGFDPCRSITEYLPIYQNYDSVRKGTSESDRPNRRKTETKIRSGLIEKRDPNRSARYPEETESARSPMLKVP